MASRLSTRNFFASVSFLCCSGAAFTSRRLKQRALCFVSAFFFFAVCAAFSALRATARKRRYDDFQLTFRRIYNYYRMDAFTFFRIQSPKISLTNILATRLVCAFMLSSVKSIPSVRRIFSTSFYTFYFFFRHQ
jgi:hypothetical protein